MRTATLLLGGILGAAAPLLAADEQLLRRCAVHKLEVPAGWTTQQHEGVINYRSADAKRSLNIAVYQLRADLDHPAGRRLVLGKSLALSREFDLDRGDNITLSSLKQSSRRGMVQARYSGHDVDTGRRFVQLSIAKNDCVQSFYFQQLDEPALESTRVMRIDTAHRRLHVDVGGTGKFNDPLSPPLAAPRQPTLPVTLPATGFLPGGF